MMKRLLAFGAVFLLAAPLAADEKAKSEPSADSKAAVAAPAAPVDSPLVAAAKRARRKSSKSVVITNETVKNATGHVTTSDSDYRPQLPPKIEPSAEVIANEQRATARALEQKQAVEAKAAEEKRQRELARRARLAEEAEQAEDGFDDGTDPGHLERDLAAEEKRPQP